MTFRRDGGFVRSERLLRIAKQIAIGINQAKTVSVEQINLWIQLNIGLTEKRAGEYIDTVVRAKGWVLRDGYISATET